MQEKSHTLYRPSGDWWPDNVRLVHFDLQTHLLSEMTERGPRLFRGAELVVFSGGIPALTALHLWDRLESGELKLTGTDPDLLCVGQGVDGEGTVGDGVCILEDPPIIVIAREAATGRRIIYCDAANFGITPEMLKASEPHLQIFCLQVEWNKYREICANLDLGGWQTTLAGQFWRGYRGQQIRDRPVCHGDERAEEAERRSLFGGRCELFYRGLLLAEPTHDVILGHYGNAPPLRTAPGGVYVVDVRSCYPTLCRGNPLPFKRIEMGEMTGGPRGDRIFAGLGDWHIQTQRPCLPCRNGDHEQYYPVGRLAGTWWGGELAFADEMAELVPSGYAGLYQLGDPGLSGFFRHILQYRKQFSDWLGPDWCANLKVGMNSVCGHFGRQRRPWRLSRLLRPGEQSWREWHEMDGEKLVRFRCLGQAEFRQDVAPEPCPESLTYISSYITMLGRRLLWRLITAAGRENVYYCDTDCLWTNGDGLTLLRASGWLSGEHGVELSVAGPYSTAELIGPKHYVLGGELTAAGLPLRATRAGPNSYRYTEHEPLGSQLGRGEKPTTKQVIRTWHPDWTGLPGKVRGNGTVDPLRVNEW